MADDKLLKLEEEARLTLSLAKAKKEIADLSGDLNKQRQAEINLIEAKIALREAEIANGLELNETGKKRVENLINEKERLEDATESQKEYSDAIDKATGLVKEYFPNVKLLAEAYDSQRVALEKVLPSQGKFNSLLADTMNASGDMGLTFEEGAKGLVELTKNFVAFSEISGQAQKNLALLTAGFKTFGIDIGKNLSISTFSMGMNAEASKNLQLELFATEKALKLPAGAIMNEFVPAMATLTQYSNDLALNVFKKLAAQSKVTGIAINELMGIVGKFDTFSDAADAAGRFNAMLGGDYLNSIELLRATEDERIEIIKRGFSLSGRQFSDLSRFEKRYVAQALGIKDVAQAQALLGSSTENLALMEKRAKAAGMSIDDFRKSQEAAKTIGEKLTLLFQKMTLVLSPIIDGLNKAASFMLDLTKNMSTGARAVGTITFAIIALGGSFKLLKGAMAFLGKGGGLIGTLLGGGKGKSSYRGASKAAGGFGLAAFGATLLKIVGVVALVAGTIAGLGFALDHASTGFSNMGTALSTLGTGIAAVYLAYYNAPGSTIRLTGAIGALATAGIAARTGAGGISMLGNALVDLSAGLRAISALDMEKIQKAMTGLKKLEVTNSKLLASVTQGVKESIVNASVSKLEQKQIQLTITHNDVGKTNESIKKAVDSLGFRVGNLESKSRKIAAAQSK